MSVACLRCSRVLCLILDKHYAALGGCNLPLPSVPGRLRGQWPRVLSRWHHVAFYQWLQWHTAPAGTLPGALCPRLGWEWHRWAARVREESKTTTVCQSVSLRWIVSHHDHFPFSIALEVWQQFGRGSKVPHCLFIFFFSFCGKPDHFYSAWFSFLVRRQLMLHNKDN